MSTKKTKKSQKKAPFFVGHTYYGITRSAVADDAPIMVRNTREEACGGLDDNWDTVVELRVTKAFKRSPATLIRIE